LVSAPWRKRGLAVGAGIGDRAAMSATVHVSRPTDGVALIEIDNPPANALGAAMRERLTAALGALEADLSVRCAVLTGRGRTFCTGDDLREAAARGAVSMDAIAAFNAMLARLESFRAPVVAAVNGHCIGGGLEVALACDIRLASTDAVFTAAGVNVGLMASVHRLPRLIGIGPAKAMLLTGLPADAQEALGYHLVTAVHEPQDLLPQALALAERIASRAPLSVEAAKRVAGRALDLSPADAAAVMDLEWAVLSASEDHADAVAAFTERRTPTFRRR
jgi:enoyl-CoA hydratase